MRALLTGGREPGPVDLRVVDGVVVGRGPRLEPVRGEVVLDLGGRYVRHGLRDAHAHVVEWARLQREVDLSGARSAAAAADLVARAHAGLRAGAVLRGGGFRDASWPDGADRALLAAAAPDRVVVLRSKDMHTAWLSPPALALAGVPEHPTGFLAEHEAWDALARLPPPAPAEDDHAVHAAAAAAQARGLTAVRDFSFEPARPAWQRLQEADGRLPLRVEAVVMPDQLPAYVEAGLRSGDGDAWLQVGPLKLFVDGSLGARTARCLTPYAGSADRGRQLLDPDQLRAALDTARAAGFAVAVHAIGDEATRDALRALHGAGLVATLEHAQLLRREDVALFSGPDPVTASIQPAHLLDDAALVDDLWRDTPSVPYAVRLLADAGVRTVFGSDAPVSAFDPWRSIAAAVHRSDGVDAPWRAEEAVPLEVALAASGGRRVRAGDAADLVVLDLPDPAGLSAGDLAQVPVHATFSGGRCVHGPWRE